MVKTISRRAKRNFGGVVKPKGYALESACHLTLTPDARRPTPDMCPHCGKNAPIIQRGLVAYCTACGQQRMPLSTTSVNLAGKPSRVGGFFIGILGWLALGGGVSFALMIGLLLTWIFPGTIAGLAIGLPIGLAAMTVGLLLLLGGRTLRKSGVETARETQVRAVFSLAENRKGIVTARDVARALDLPVDQSDALLTQLAKERSDEVGVEIGEDGDILYVFPRVPGYSRMRFEQPTSRIEPSSPKPPENEAESLAEIEAAEAEREALAIQRGKQRR